LLRFADRKSLLLGTALASTLLLGTMVAPRPAHAVVGCAVAPGSAIYVQADDSIVCINTETRPAEPVTAVPASPASVAIFLQTPATATLGVYSIYLNNSGTLTTGPASTGSLYGIYTNSGNDLSPITILNSGDATLSTTESSTLAAGIRANSGAARVTASVGSAFGLRAHTYGEQSSIAIENSGALQVTGNDAAGIYAVTACCDAPISIVNSGDIDVEGRFTAAGIFAATAGPASPIAISTAATSLW
jgi:hypothetical protein